MRPRTVFFIVIPLTALLTVLIYNPASVLIFRITEPYFECPVKSCGRGIIIRNDAMGEGEFGAKRRNSRTHSGIDIKAPIGDGVYASKSGIAFCGNVPTGYGRYVMIYHPDGFQTFYGHLLDWKIPKVKKVRQGERIGSVGKTGNAYNKLIEPHLHFEIRKDGEPQDPKNYMRR